MEVVQYECLIQQYLFTYTKWKLSFLKLIKTLKASKNSISRRTLDKHIIDEHI